LNYKMKNFKFVFIIISTIVLIFVLSFSSFAFDETAYETFDDSGAYEVFDSLDEETKEILSDLGIEDINAESVFKISPKRIVEEIIKIVSGKLAEPIKLFFTLSLILIIESVFKSVSNEEKNSISEIIFILLISTAAAVPSYEVITFAASFLLTASDFLISFIPVYAFLLSSSGNITQALNFNTLLYGASQLIISVSKNILIPVMGVLMSLNIASSVNPILPLNKITGTFKKVVTVTLTLISTLFIGFLSFKGSVAASVDALTVRSIRTVSGSVIPFIGSSLADAYSSVLGSLKLINNCFGFLGIITVCVLTLPVIIELLLYYFSLHLASVTGEMLGCESSKILEGMAGVISIVNVIVIFVSVIFTVSIGIVLKAGGSV